MHHFLKTGAKVVKFSTYGPLKIKILGFCTFFYKFAACFLARSAQLTLRQI